MRKDEIVAFLIGQFPLLSMECLSQKNVKGCCKMKIMSPRKCKGVSLTSFLK